MKDPATEAAKADNAVKPKETDNSRPPGDGVTCPDTHIDTKMPQETGLQATLGNTSENTRINEVNSKILQPTSASDSTEDCKFTQVNNSKHQETAIKTESCKFGEIIPTQVEIGEIDNKEECGKEMSSRFNKQPVHKTVSSF